MSYLSRFEIQSPLSFTCWRVRVRQDGSVALLHNVSGFPDIVSKLSDAGSLLEWGEQDGMRLVLTPDRAEFIDLRAWKPPRAEAEGGEFTRLFAKPVLTDRPTPTISVEPPAMPVGSDGGEFTSFFLAGEHASPAPEVREPSESPTATVASPILQPPSRVEPGDGEPSLLNQRWTGRAMSVSSALPKPEPQPAPPPSSSSEFTRMFQAQGNAEQVQSSAFLKPPTADLSGATRIFSVNEDPQAAESGEFTSLFQAPARQGPAEPSDAGKTRIFSVNEDSVPAAGEFTRMFQAPPDLEKPASPAPPPQPQAPSSMGECTSFFQAGKPSASPVAPSREASPAAHSEPGGFTALFEAPRTPNARSETSSPAPPSSDFDSFFGSPLGSNQEAIEARLNDGSAVYSEPAMAQEPGQFTRLFGREEVAAALGGGQPAGTGARSAGPVSGHSLFPALPMERERPVPAVDPLSDPGNSGSAGPSEFSRVFQRPAPVAPAPPPAVPAASAIENIKAAKGQGSAMWKKVLMIVALIVAALAAFYIFYLKHR